MEDYSFWEIDYNPGSRLGEDEVSMRKRQGARGITFNKKVSGEIVAGGFVHYRVREDNITGEINFIFIKDSTVGYKFSVQNGKNNKNVMINNLCLVKRLYEHFGLDEYKQNYVGKVSRNISHSEDYYTVKVEFKR